MDDINNSDVETIYLNKQIVSRSLALRILIFALFIASTYFLLSKQQQTLSIVITPCGNDSRGA